MFLSAWLKSNIKIITVKNEGSLLIMKNRRMRLMAIFAAGVLSVTSMGGIVTAHAEETLARTPQRKPVQVRFRWMERMLRQQKMAVWQLPRA